MLYILNKYGIPLEINPDIYIIFDGIYYAVVWVR